MSLRFPRSIELALCAAVVLAPISAQHLELQPVPEVSFPAPTDSNSPALWWDGELVLFNSTGLWPVRSSGRDQFNLGNSEPVVLGSSIHHPYWIEATWKDQDGTILAWYHHEPPRVCGSSSNLTAPEIGALLSTDGGQSFWDLGIILESGYPPDCSSQNGYFAGGHGDFSVLLNRNRTYFYFLFGNYGGPPETQGVVIARLPFDRRYNPYGAVEKYFAGDWLEPGIGGQVSPIFPVVVDWQNPNTDAFWGPSVHWNSYLEKYVMLLNHSCCSPGWPQEGIYVSYNKTLFDPTGWTTPEKILDGVFWYPQVLGRGPGETDKLSGRIARLYVYGVSDWRIVFHK